MSLFETNRRAGLNTKTTDIQYTAPDPLPTDNAHIFSVKPGLTVPIVMPKHPFYREYLEPFDLERYQYSRAPIDLGHARLPDPATLLSELNTLRLHVKYPGTDFRLPSVLKPVAELIERVAEYEAGFNTRLDECFVHVTVDKSKVESGQTHRYPGFHGDGVQGAKFSQEHYTIIEHSYIVATAPPTEFCIQPFFFSHLNDSKHNLFHEMELQAREANIYNTISGHLYLTDPYMVHRTPFIAETTERLFVRITFAFAELKISHNTKNPLFPGQVFEDRHDVRKFFTPYPANVPWEMYGLSSGPKRGV